ncbi:GNAT family N-acetyltransferase [candidate division KSB1 bacterium]|nr:MAG: GNAT family N-acetyltransferase [candidate division KSB1 bacterium]MBC6948434.1 GNAT family N-acetyltransferase [candidate division KSB1 bacterium]MCE7940200.1 GNAT family N-acetyltransferase [Chlorobi bacterium CHB1]
MSKSTAETPVERNASPPEQTDLRICRYNAKAIPEVLKLVKVTLGNEGAVRKTEAFWRWKHEDNHFGSSYGLYASDETQALAVGLRVLMRWQFCTKDGQMLRAVRAVDTATHPAYQRLGIFSKLTRQAVEDLKQEGVDLIFNTPNAQSLPGYLKMGWQVVAKWPLYIRVLKPIRMLSRRFKSIPASQQIIKFEAFFAPGIMTWQAFAERYGEDISKLVVNWEQQRRQTGLRTFRDFNYIQWRYGQHPHLTYGFYAFEHGDRLAGFAILRPNWRYGWQEIVLTELFLQQADIKLGRSFLKHLIKQLRGDYLVTHFSAPTFEKALLRRAGFLKVPKQGMTFTVNPLSVRSQSALAAAAWDLTLGDLEIF